MNKVTAVLINVLGIQQYIFNSNKLKENIGGSYIIEQKLYGDIMKDILMLKFGVNDIFSWKDNAAIKIINESGISCEVGYIGGGNAFLLFKNTDLAKEFIKEFSTNVLLYYPGLQLAFGLKEEFDLANGNYKAEFQFLLEDLKERKSRNFPIVKTLKYGITADCPLSNDCAEVLDTNSGKFISTTSSSRIGHAVEVQSQNSLNKLYPQLGSEYTLTDEIDQLGQSNESAYIAVVHIDGNGMGKVFSKIDSLELLRKKSAEVSAKANLAMQKLISHIIEIKTKLFKSGLELKRDNDKMILPIRPILVGGDDITFVCEGKLGIYLAEKFIEYFYDESERNKSHEDRIMDGACAGVAIVKTHFPFYKAVQLAEELCAEAKVPTRGKGNEGSYISYFYSATTFSGTLDELRSRTHSTPNNQNLYFGPYKLFDGKKLDCISNLKNGISHFNSWPKNKVMKLRDILMESKASQDLFIKELKEIRLALPKHKEGLWSDNKTPYFDQIELQDFYLSELIK